MDFKTATDALFDRVTHEDLADALGVSVPTIRQARLSSKSMAYREAPQKWELAVKTLAEGRIRHYRGLIERLGDPLRAGSAKRK